MRSGARMRRAAVSHRHWTKWHRSSRGWCRFGRILCSRRRASGCCGRRKTRLRMISSLFEGLCKPRSRCVTACVFVDFSTTVQLLTGIIVGGQLDSCYSA